MQNLEIADRLTELADLLEIQGANPFRIRAYRNAVRTIREQTRPLAAMVADEEDLKALPGIGDDLAGHIQELVETGRLSLLEEVAAEVPRELALLTRLDGVGPKKAQKLWKELGVTNLPGLEAAIREGKVEALDGFGKKSAEKILRSIGEFEGRQGRFLRSEAVQLLRPLLEHMETAPGVDRLEVAGSYRRGCETVGDIDLLAVLREEAGDEAGDAAGEAAGEGAGGDEGSEAGEDGGDEAGKRAGEGTGSPPGRAAMEHFTKAPGVSRVEMSGDTRGSVVLGSGLSVDLRIVPEESYGAALHYFTGSKEHNVQLRGRARERGLRISEYGVFRDDDSEERVGGRTEEEVFASVEVPWIPPVLREGRGEIEAAIEGRLPRLVELEDIRGDLHMHTRWSDGRDTIEEMALAARERGYAYLAITDHSQALAMTGGLTPERLREQAEEIEEVRGRLTGIRLLHGCEVDILKDGSLDLPDDALEILDLVIVAVHSHFQLDGAAQTERVLRALEHPLVDLLAHPTGRLINRREPHAVDVEAVLEAAAELDVAVELNANPLRLDLHERHLFRARELGVLVSIGSDAHRIAQLAHMESGIVQARRGWLEADRILNTRDADELVAWLGRRDP
jgi:DNA polymerase (family X)